MKPPLLVILGPTAVGKSALAMCIAERFDGEIVSADSRQIYRHMDIGTAKPSTEDLAVVPHHLIDIVNPDEDYSLVLFLQQANDAIQNVNLRGNLPILAGGTGQYVWGLLEGWQVPSVTPNPELRRHLEERAEAEGGDVLYSELSRLNPEAAERIDPRNVRRVIRALEIAQSQSPIDQSLKSPPPYETKIIGLTLERADLYRRIDQRVDSMMEEGFLDEVSRLMEMGYARDLPAMSSVGYQELMQHLQGELALDDAIQRIKYRTHRIARQQYGWFRLDDPRINWFDISTSLDDAADEASTWVESVR